ncbi:MAG: peptide-methionine (S)-S-oxide reductase MsrA [Lachnospiraceae bacterium]|nr:peptide-methionine (S)-S-oxide reductase MsrA [Lachnospiraceae bacterium]
MKTIYLAGGCFWGTQKFFDQFDGVLETCVGYANGKTENPSYEEVRYQGTGHAETVKIGFDPEKISVTELLNYYFMAVDPLSVNKQGEDEGTQYRTGIYVTDESMMPEIAARVKEEETKLGSPLAVEVKPLENFYTAEEYHQKYLDKNPDGYCHIPFALLNLTKR